LGFGLLAVGIHSFSDYGQHMPANFGLSAIFCALMVTLARTKEGEVVGERARAHRPSLLRIISFVTVVSVCVWALAETDTVRRAEKSWDEALSREQELRANNW